MNPELQADLDALLAKLKARPSHLSYGKFTGLLRCAYILHGMTDKEMQCYLYAIRQVNEYLDKHQIEWEN